MLQEKEYITELTRGAVSQHRMLKKDQALAAWHEAVCLNLEEIFWQTLAETNAVLATTFVEDLYYRGEYNQELHVEGYPLHYGLAKAVVDQFARR